MQVNMREKLSLEHPGKEKRDNLSQVLTYVSQVRLTFNEVVKGSLALPILDIDITAGLTQVLVKSVQNCGIVTR